MPTRRSVGVRDAGRARAVPRSHAGRGCRGGPRRRSTACSRAAGSCSGRSSRRSRRSSRPPAERAHAVGVGNGTDAIALLLRACGVGAGDEVIVPAMTAAFTGLAVVAAAAQPGHRRRRSGHADHRPGRVRARAITPRTRAIVPVHLYGQAADMQALTARWPRAHDARRSWKTAARRIWPRRGTAGRHLRARRARSASTRPRTSARWATAAR